MQYFIMEKTYASSILHWYTVQTIVYLQPSQIFSSFENKVLPTACP